MSFSLQSSRDPVASITFRTLLLKRLLGLPLALMFLAATAWGQSDGSQLSGTVSNSSTGNTLPDVVLVIPDLGRQTATDQTGRYVFHDLPPGTHRVEVTYADFSPANQVVTLGSAARVQLDFELEPADVMLLQAFTVAAEREGNALAVTKQHRAPNVRNVMALDSDISATVPNMNVGELITRISGVSGSYDQGTVNNVSLRGMDFRLTRMTFDGMSSIMAVDGRRPTFTYFSGSLFGQVEIVKALTPDMQADAIGGMINLSTRSPLSMSERRRFSYDFGVNVTSPWSDYKPEQQRDKNIQPFGQFSYTEVFDVGKGKRNLGISIDSFYGESQYEIGTLWYQYQANKPTDPVYIWDARARDSINNRQLTGLNVKVEYKPSDSSTLYANFMYNLAREPNIELQSVRAFSNRTIATIDSSGNPTGNGAILPDYTNTQTEVRAVNNSDFNIRNYDLSASSRSKIFTVGGRHEHDAVDFDYSFRYNTDDVDSDTRSEGGDLTYTAPRVGWVVDRSDGDSFNLVQTAGPSIYDLDSYTKNVRFDQRDDETSIDILEGQANASYEFDTRFPFVLTGGIGYRHHEFANASPNERRWRPAAGADSLPEVFMPPTPFMSEYPIVDPTAVVPLLSDPTLWTEDLYYGASQVFAGYKGVTEEIAHQYLMGDLRINRLRIVGGVRFEQTDVESFANRMNPAASAAEYPDPVQRAAVDWDNLVTVQGSFDKAFPSLHLTYNIRDNLVARASYYTSVGRPTFTTLMPTATINNNQQFVTVGNPSVRPQFADNYDFKLAYYLKPAGVISVGYFHKSIEDYQLTTMVGTVDAGEDNGFQGNYEGYEIRSTVNAGTATIEGWEFDYRQQFVRLPGALKGLGIAANYTLLDTKGDYGGSTVLTNSEVAGFVPESGSVSLTYKYGKFGTRLVVNLREPMLEVYSASETERVYNDRRSTVSLNLNYRWSSKLQFYLQFNNIAQQTQDDYFYDPSRLRTRQFISSAIQFGVKGQF